MVEDSRLLVNNAFTNNAVSHGGAKEALEQVVVESTTFSPVPATLKTKAVITGGALLLSHRTKVTDRVDFGVLKELLLTKFMNGKSKLVLEREEENSKIAQGFADGWIQKAAKPKKRLVQLELVPMSSTAHYTDGASYH